MANTGQAPAGTQNQSSYVRHPIGTDSEPSTESTLWPRLRPNRADGQDGHGCSGCWPGTRGCRAVRQPVYLGPTQVGSALCKPPSHLVGCSLLKRSLITGVPLNMRPRYKDFMLLATLKGTQGKMSCQNGSEEHQAGARPGSAPLPVTQGLAGLRTCPVSPHSPHPAGPRLTHRRCVDVRAGLLLESPESL